MLLSIIYFSKALDDSGLTELTTIFFCFSLIQAFDGTKLFYVNKYSNSLLKFDINHVFSNYLFGLLVSFLTVATFFIIGVLDDIKTLCYLILCGSISISMTPLNGVIEAKGKVYLSSLFRGIFVSSTYAVFILYYIVVGSIDGITKLLFIPLIVYVFLIIREVRKTLKLSFKDLDIQRVPSTIKELSSFIQFNVLGVMTSYTERVALSVMFPNSIVGIFNSQSEVYQRTNLIFRVLSAVLNPRLAKLNSRVNIVDVGFEISILLASLTAIIVAFINYNVDYIIANIFNDGFVNYAITFKVGISLLVFSSVNYVSSIIMAIKDQFRVQKNNYLYSFLLYLPAVFLFSYYCGYFGFAVSLVVLRFSDVANVYYLSKMTSFKGLWLLYLLMFLSVFGALVDIYYEFFIATILIILAIFIYSMVLVYGRYSELKENTHYNG